MVEKVVNVKVTDNIDQTAKSVGTLKTQLRQAQNEVNELSAKFGATSEQAVNAAKRAAELKDAIGDAKQLTDAFNPDAKFKALTATLGGVAGGFSAVQGAVGLLGSESANVEKAILKVQSAMAISQGIQAIGESVDSFKQLGAVIRATSLYQKALSAATAVQTFVMNGATLAAKALRGALIATGVGALVVGVGLLIANFDKVKKVVMNLIPGLSAVGDVVMSIVNTVTDFIGVTSEAERANDRLKANASASIALNKKYLAEHGSQLDEFTKQKLAAKDKYNEAIQEENADRVALAKELNRELDAINKARQAENDKKAKEAQDKIDAKEKEARDKRKEKRDKQLEDESKDAEDLASAKREQLANTIALENEITQAIGDAQDKNAEMFMSAEEAEIRAVNDKYFRLKELAIQQGKDINDIELQQLNEANDIRLKYQNERDAIDKEAREKQIENEKLVAQAKKEIQQQTLDVASAGISLAKDLAGKNKSLQKGLLIAESAVGIAKIITNTQSANSAVTAKYALLPGGPAFAATEIALNTASAGIGIAANLSATSKALSALGGGGSAGGGQSVGGAKGGANAPKFNIVGQSETNQLAQSINQKENRPIEAYVVSSAVSTSQALDRNRVKTATFGA